MREEVHLPLFLPRAIFAADEVEPNVYDRLDGRGKWCHPASICIFSLAAPANTIYKSAEGLTAGGLWWCLALRGTVPKVSLRSYHQEEL